MNRNLTVSRVALLSLVLASVLASSQAFGQSMITQTDTYSNVNDSVTGSGGAGYNLTFNQFDTSLGTLTGVQVIMSGVDVSGTVSVQNFSSVSQVYTNIGLVGNYTVTDSVGNNVAVAISSPTFTSGTVTAHGTAGDTYTTPTTANTIPGGASQTIPSSSFSIYQGTGTSTINLALSSKNTGTATGTGSFLVGESSMGSGTVQLIYTYTPVPEPAQTAAWMLCFALCFIGGRKYWQSRELASI